MLFLFYNDLDLNQQSDLFSFLGDSLNENNFKVTTDNFKNAKDLDIEELKLATVGLLNRGKLCSKLVCLHKEVLGFLRSNLAKPMT